MLDVSSAVGDDPLVYEGKVVQGLSCRRQEFEPSYGGW